MYIYAHLHSHTTHHTHTTHTTHHTHDTQHTTHTTHHSHDTPLTRLTTHTCTGICLTFTCLSLNSPDDHLLDGVGEPRVGLSRFLEAEVVFLIVAGYKGGLDTLHVIRNGRDCNDAGISDAEGRGRKYSDGEPHVTLLANVGSGV